MCKGGGTIFKQLKHVYTLLDAATGDNADGQSLFFVQLFIGNIEHGDWPERLRSLIRQVYSRETRERKPLCYRYTTHVVSEKNEVKISEKV